MGNYQIKSVTIGIPIKNLKETSDWYRKFLPGQEELSPMEGIWEISVTASVWLQFFESDDEATSSRSINLETDNIEKSREHLISLGIDVGEIVVVPEAVQYFEFSDPFGNNFSFVQLLN